ncbi:MetQ/NlpA family ABC transporter substrate-binding protein [Marinospirillum alkaliphilum]|uniref:D-methionine transport system substrate-binding protein n=1 Tax=Marinospirillum alkaliphilum DSM 21637 TaxID=1122209 RepID=A0A1K1YPH9_9GAMM|nr:MetQ/NlpA family ABC transporter substrate-binding protein [Marinospirillum alkaliphilum]SFX63347.1 D-methionine transport system substrate-binding protein [Marinospirillum alkaliphilum DSM 21637]
MKKILTGLLLLVAVSFQVQAQQTLQVAATAVPHAEILEFLKPALAEQGVNLQVRVFTDYVQPNVQVNEGRLDANFFQHQPYLTNFNASRGTQLVSVAGVHVEPFGAYSSKHTRLDALPQRAQIAIPNDATNGGRALLLLQQAGVITLKPEAGITATVRDIQDNPKRLRFRELEAATLPRILNQVDLALINTNYALEAGLNPSADALVIEGAESPYVNILVVREGKEQDEGIQKLVVALKTEAVRQFIAERYQGAVVPAF